MKQGLVSAGVCALLLLSSTAPAMAQDHAISSKPPEYWQAFAKADLDAAHQAVLDDHPGMLDELNPGFRDWSERGYREALQLQPQVFMHALWRVSEQSLKAAHRGLDRDVSLYGADSDRAKDERAFIARLEAAKAAGQPWVIQEAGPLLTRAEMQRRGARLKRYPDARVLLVTDGVCASACLDMADEVLQVPGSLHLGQVTSADSLYIDVGRVRMPSGNTLIVPLKVWRNRPRGNNEPLVPDVPVKAIEDDAAVRAAVLSALQRP